MVTTPALFITERVDSQKFRFFVLKFPPPKCVCLHQLAENRGEANFWRHVGFEVMDPTAHSKIRGNVAGQVSPPAKK